MLPFYSLPKALQLPTYELPKLPFYWENTYDSRVMGVDFYLNSFGFDSFYPEIKNYPYTIENGTTHYISNRKFISCSVEKIQDLSMMLTVRAPVESHKLFLSKNVKIILPEKIDPEVQYCLHVNASEYDAVATLVPEIEILRKKVIHDEYQEWETIHNILIPLNNQIYRTMNLFYEKLSPYYEERFHVEESKKQRIIRNELNVRVGELPLNDLKPLIRLNPDVAYRAFVNHVGTEWVETFTRICLLRVVSEMQLTKKNDARYQDITLEEEIDVFLMDIFHPKSNDGRV